MEFTTNLKMTLLGWKPTFAFDPLETSAARRTVCHVLDIDREWKSEVHFSTPRIDSRFILQGSEIPARFNTGELGPVSLRMALEDSQTIIHLGVIFTIDLVCRN